jgi:eukaryotic-like serine/threonine-protein kinase
LMASGQRKEAIAEYLAALRVSPDYVWARHGLSVAYFREGRLEVAIEESREAVRVHPEFAEARDFLCYLFHAARRWPELRVAWQKEIAANPATHDAWFGYAELCLFLREEEEYRRVRREQLARFGGTTDPTVAERTSRACLLLPASGEELRQAAAIAERTVAAGRSGHEYAYPYFLFARGLAEYRQGHSDDAIRTMKGDAAKVMGPCPRLVTAMALYRKGKADEARKALAAAVQSFDWRPAKVDGHDAWIAHILRREAEGLIGPEPAAPKGK